MRAKKQQLFPRENCWETSWYEKSQSRKQIHASRRVKPYQINWPNLRFPGKYLSFNTYFSSFFIINQRYGVTFDRVKSQYEQYYQKYGTIITLEPRKRASNLERSLVPRSSLLVLRSSALVPARPNQKFIFRSNRGENGVHVARVCSANTFWIQMCRRIWFSTTYSWFNPARPARPHSSRSS